MQGMNTSALRPWIVAFVLSYATAGIGGALTELGPWYAALRQPAWKPPDAAFGIVWSLLFTLCAISAAIAWRAAQTPSLRRRVLGLFGLNAVLNMLWSALYFKLQRPDWALVEVLLLWLSILALMLGLWRLSRLASALMAPYLAWVTLAGGLNLATVQLNGPFG